LQTVRPAEVRKLFEKIPSRRVAFQFPDIAKTPIRNSFRSLFTGNFPTKINLPGIHALLRSEEKTLRETSLSSPNVPSKIRFLKGREFTGGFPKRILPGLSWILVLAAGFLFFGKELKTADPALVSHSVSAGSSPHEDILLEQEKTIRRLNAEVLTTSRKIQNSRKILDDAKSREADYRDEVLRISLRYQQEIDTLRRSLEAQEAILENLENEAEIAKLTRAAINEKTVSPEVTAGQKPAEVPPQLLEGKVVMINSRYEFLVIDNGARSGVRPGQEVLVPRHGGLTALGVVEEVYPGVSGVSVKDRTFLLELKEGDPVRVRVS